VRKYLSTVSVYEVQEISIRTPSGEIEGTVVGIAFLIRERPAALLQGFCRMAALTFVLTDIAGTGIHLQHVQSTYVQYSTSLQRMGIEVDAVNEREVHLGNYRLRIYYLEQALQSTGSVSEGLR